MNYLISIKLYFCHNTQVNILLWIAEASLNGPRYCQQIGRLALTLVFLMKSHKNTKVKLQVSNLALLHTDRHVPLCSTCCNGCCQMTYFLSGHKLALDFSTSPVSNHPLPGHVRVRLKDLLELDSRFMRTRCNQASPRGLGRTAGVWPFAS